MLSPLTSISIGAMQQTNTQLKYEKRSAIEDFLSNIFLSLSLTYRRKCNFPPIHFNFHILFIAIPLRPTAIIEMQISPQLYWYLTCAGRYFVFFFAFLFWVTQRSVRKKYHKPNAIKNGSIVCKLQPAEEFISDNCPAMRQTRSRKIPKNNQILWW